MLYIGIDTGVHTGLAVWESECKAFDAIATLPIHQALDRVRRLHDAYGEELVVVFEDARQRKYLPRERNASEYRGRLQGAGSVKRDAGIWEDFCKDLGIRYEAVAPKAGLTKWNEKLFKAATGWEGRTSNHARDAALLVFNRR